MNDLKEKNIGCLNLGARLTEILLVEGIKSVEQLEMAYQNSLKQIPGVGYHSMIKIKHALQGEGVLSEHRTEDTNPFEMAQEVIKSCEALKPHLMNTIRKIEAKLLLSDEDIAILICAAEKNSEQTIRESEPCNQKRTEAIISTNKILARKLRTLKQQPYPSVLRYIDSNAAGCFASGKKIQYWGAISRFMDKLEERMKSKDVAIHAEAQKDALVILKGLFEYWRGNRAAARGVIEREREVLLKLAIRHYTRTSGEPLFRHKIVSPEYIQNKLDEFEDIGGATLRIDASSAQMQLIFEKAGKQFKASYLAVENILKHNAITKKRLDECINNHMSIAMNVTDLVEQYNTNQVCKRLRNISEYQWGAC